MNEIVLGEESDIDAEGNPKSHFEMYLDAMKEAEADIQLIRELMLRLGDGEELEKAMDNTKICDSIKEFVRFTFEAINIRKSHIIAAVFTFGREDLIPDMFIELVKGIQQNEDTSLNKLVYYLERHIELDRDEHGPLSLEMVASLCHTPEQWNEALVYSKRALEHRIQLWNGITEKIKLKTLVC